MVWHVHQQICNMGWKIGRVETATLALLPRTSALHLLLLNLPQL
jgi:hypothetical protein